MYLYNDNIQLPPFRYCLTGTLSRILRNRLLKNLTIIIQTNIFL